MPSTQHELLPLVTQENNVLVDARLLHLKLKSGYQFSHWISSRIKDYGFEENRDFFKNFSKSTGGRQAQAYLLSLDMAKELAMLERNEVGRNIRRYFIAKEKELRAVSALPNASELFKGLKKKRFNDRDMYPYMEVRTRAGYSNKGSSAGHRAKYWMHFLKEGSVLYVTKEFALHLYHQKSVYNNRQVMLQSQPVLPQSFGNTLELPFGKGGAA